VLKAKGDNTKSLKARKFWIKIKNEYTTTSWNLLSQ